MHYGFIDFEMTCDGKIVDDRFIDDHRMPFTKREIISVGFIICDDKYNIKNRYESVVRPLINPELTEYCIRLTGLHQSQVNAGKKCNKAFGDVLELCNRYSVDKIFSYGTADKQVITINAKGYKKINESVGNIYAVKSKLVDVEKTIVKAIGAKGTPGLQKVVARLGIKKKGQIHDAMDDAMYLYKICKELDLRMIDT